VVVEAVASFDTFIYPAILIIAWNFLWTNKVRQKVFGDTRDDTSDGMAVRVEEHEKRIEKLEHKNE